MNTKHNTVQEAAEKLKMSEAWVRKQIFEKKIKHLKIGRRVFILEPTIDEILQSGIVEPVDQGQA